MASDLQNRNWKQYIFNYGKTNSSVEEKYKTASPNYNLSLLQKIDSTGGQIRLSVGYNNYTEQVDKQMNYAFFDNSDNEVAPASKYTAFSNREL
ncbi:MAG: hypothetical protein IPJ32_14235 [Sphingobacteriaceae bacterium]|nr:hypothetical protein [Sphingobacteriaceae bacterium]